MDRGVESLLHDVITRGGIDESMLVAAFGLASGVLVFLRGFGLWRRHRWIEDTPTARVRSMPLGRVELHGRAQAKAELAAPFTGEPCVFYRYRIEEETGSGRRRRWREIAAGDSSAWPFYLEDETGRVLVDPRDASVEIAVDYRETNPPLVGALLAFLDERGIDPEGWFGLRRKLRFTQWHIAPGEALFVLGVAQPRAGLALERRQRIAGRLAALKGDRRALAELDRDRDGNVSPEEWEVARRLAVEAVDRETVDDRIAVSADAHRSIPFVVADAPEALVLRSLRWRALGCIVGGAALHLFCLAFLLGRFGLIGRS